MGGKEDGTGEGGKDIPQKPGGHTGGPDDVKRPCRDAFAWKTRTDRCLK